MKKSSSQELSQQYCEPTIIRMTGRRKCADSLLLLWSACSVPETFFLRAILPSHSMIHGESHVWKVKVGVGEGGGGGYSINVGGRGDYVLREQPRKRGFFVFFFP